MSDMITNKKVRFIWGKVMWIKVFQRPEPSMAAASYKLSGTSSRPEIKNMVENMQDYNVIFVGFPIWWYIAPTIINTFLETYDFSGKKIVLFATSGGSGFGRTVERLKDSVSETAQIVEGKVLNGTQTTDELNKMI